MQTATGSQVLSDTVKLEADVRDAVERGVDVQEVVRRLTLRTMGAHTANLEVLRDLATAVLRGARAGVQTQMRQSEERSQQARQRLKEAVGGLEDGLGHFAEASQLALEEAVRRAQAYSRDDLMRARADLQQLEQMYLETLQEAATAARDEAGQILGDLAGHVRTHGSAMSTRLVSALQALAQQLAAHGQARVEMGLHLVQVTSDTLRQIAAGVLTRAADHIKPHGREQ